MLANYTMGAGMGSLRRLALRLPAGFPARSRTPERGWSQPGSNRRPLPCHGSALPTELWPQGTSGSPLSLPGRVDRFEADPAAAAARGAPSKLKGMKPRHLHSHRSGRRYELRVSDAGLRNRVELRRDGELIAEKRGDERINLEADSGERLEVRLTLFGRVRRATLYVDGVGLDMDAEPGTRAARRQNWERAHPRLAAARHVAEGVASVLVAVLGVGALLGAILDDLLAPVEALIDKLVGWIPWPRIGLPSIALPSIDLPDLPSVSPPGWIVAILDTAEYWGPIAAGIALAIWELRRQKRQRELRERLAAGREAGGEGDGRRPDPDEEAARDRAEA